MAGLVPEAAELDQQAGVARQTAPGAWRHVAAAVLLVSVAAMILVTHLVAPVPVLVDDGVLSAATRRASAALAVGDVNYLNREYRAAGRFYPALTGWWLARYLLVGDDLRLQFLLNAVLMSGCALALYGTLWLLLRRWWIAVAAAAAFLLHSANTEVFFRLYAAELPLTALLAAVGLSAVWASVASRASRVTAVTVGMIATVLACLSKEVAFVAVSGFAVGWAVRRFLAGDRRAQTATFAWWSLAGAIGALLWLGNRTAAGIAGGWYVGAYQPTPGRLALNAGKYLVVLLDAGGPLGLVVLVLGAIAVVRFLRRPADPWLAWASVWFVSGVSLVAVYLPWQFAVGRYLTPAIWFLTLAGALASYQTVRRGTPWVRGVFIVLLVCYFATNAVRVTHAARWSLIRGQADGRLISTLAALPLEAGRRIRVVAQSPPPEAVSQIGALVGLRQGGPPAPTSSLPSTADAASVEPGDYVVFATREGDGHFTSEWHPDQTFNREIFQELKPRLTLITQISSSARSVTVYWDAPLYNMLLTSRSKLPATVMSLGPERRFVDAQRFRVEWQIFRCVS